MLQQAQLCKTKRMHSFLVSSVAHNRGQLAAQDNSWQNCIVQKRQTSEGSKQDYSFVVLLPSFLILCLFCRAQFHHANLTNHPKPAFPYTATLQII